MPSRPGDLPVIEQAHAGMVMGGVMLARSPCIPRRISALMFGISSAIRSNRSCGVPQSSPITATRGPCPTILLRDSYESAAAPSRSDRLESPGIVPARDRHPRPDRPVNALRRTLYLQAAVWALAGAALAVAPR